MITFFEILPDDITAMIGFSSDLVADLMPLVVVVLGVYIGLYIVRAILNSIM